MDLDLSGTEAAFVLANRIDERDDDAVLAWMMDARSAILEFIPSR